MSSFRKRRWKSALPTVGVTAPRLTPREQQVLSLLAMALPTRRLPRRLGYPCTPRKFMSAGLSTPPMPSGARMRWRRRRGLARSGFDPRRLGSRVGKHLRLCRDRDTLRNVGDHAYEQPARRFNARRLRRRQQPHEAPVGGGASRTRNLSDQQARIGRRSPAGADMNITAPARLPRGAGELGRELFGPPRLNSNALDVAGCIALASAWRNARLARTSGRWATPIRLESARRSRRASGLASARARNLRRAGSQHALPLWLPFPGRIRGSVATRKGWRGPAPHWSFGGLCCAANGEGVSEHASRPELRGGFL